MNTIQRLAYPLIAVLSMGAAFAAHAESPTVDDSATQVWSQTKTRAQVQAELFAARADGSTRVYSISYNPLTVAKTTTTREAVRAEARVERAVNPSAQMVGEDSGSFYLAQLPLSRDASHVLADKSR
ncbi:MAG: DUF4148 domain-containing protein [Rubrivivax sp.]|nr:DUF4148 domain-containing protein [Rubrivivax sp.]MDP3614398.1 DUF4148 domain-containing protein [Rubrivivax sp.]